MGSWTFDDIPWERFDGTRLDRDILAIVKAASLVEANGSAYARHLCLVFADDPQFQESARRWGEEEDRHGFALGRWAALADPKFDFAAALARFRDGYRIDFERQTSRRGSRCGEMIARCIVETGTSSYYTALCEAAQEPVLKEICRRVAADELRHFKLFYKTMQRYRKREGVGLADRLAVAVRRLAEASDDELAYAYYAANDGERPYDRGRCGRAYARRAYAVYRRHHVERGVAMIMKAVGLAPQGRLARTASAVAWRAMRWRCARFAQIAA
jgi:Fatty acid desaturase